MSVADEQWRVTEADVASELVGAELGEWLVAEVGASIEGCGALVTATETAGATESVGFWGEVTERGARLANPRVFPWTLASAPAGHLAMHCGVRGPVVNFVGGHAATAAALEMALDLLDDGIVERVAVVAIARSAERTAVATLVIHIDDECRTALRRIAADHLDLLLRRRA